MQHRAHEYLKGLRLGVPIVFGYVPVAIAFGLVCRNAGLPPHVALLFSALVFAGASQFMAVEMLALGIDGLQIIAATLAVNFRHFLMSSSIASRVPQPVVAFGITDEVFAVASAHPGTLTPRTVLGIETMAYVAWTGGSVAGALAGEILPLLLQQALGVTLYALFVSLLVPRLARDRSVIAAAVAAVAIRLGLGAAGWFPAGVVLLFAIAGGAAAGALVGSGGRRRQEAGE
ncbi:MAG: branched-chain amino acid ABC transporter permease [Spirochaetes bacterium]|jgi:4-azaleucine resistance transporter AzlC|nr:branched-chain amino acid ABC transporter permease [Spirochaetota bacterium]